MAVVISQNTVMSVMPSGGLNKPIIGWDNIIRNATTWGSAVAPEVGYPSTNMQNTSTASEWRSSSVADQYISAVFSTGQSDVDYLAIARHNLGSIGASVRVIVLYASDPATSVPVSDYIVPADDSPLVIRFSIDEPIIRVGLQFANIVGAVPPRIAVMYAGTLTVVSGGMYQEVVPIPYSYQTDIVTGRAESGDFLGRIVTDQSMQMAYEFAYVDYDWFRANMGPFMKNAMLNPFFFAWLPKQYPNDVTFGWLQSDINPIAERFDNTVVVRFGMDMGGLAV